MTKSEIITKFRLFMDDTTELSTQEESDLFDKIYLQVTSDRPWEFTKKAFTGTQSTSVPYIALPSDFAYLAIGKGGEKPVILVGSTYEPYEVINFADRRSYVNKKGYAYVDIVNNNLVFTAQPTDTLAVEYDYCAVPASLNSGQSPAFPARFHDIIYHGMCADEFMIEQSDKLKSYRNENLNKYRDYMDLMAYWNSRLVQI